MDQRGSDREVIRVLQALRAMRINWGDDLGGEYTSVALDAGPAVDVPVEVIAALNKMSKPAIRSLLIEAVWRLRDDLP